MSSSDRARLLEEASAGSASLAEEQPNNQMRHHFSPVDINQLLDQDEREVAYSRKKVIFVDSDGEEVDSEDSEETEDASAAPSPEPYIHPPIRLCDEDIDYPEGMSEDDKAQERRALGRLSCVSISSSATDEEIDWVMQFYYQEGIWARPMPAMRPHIFSIGNFSTPRIVLTPHLIKLGVGAPLHPYFKEILEWFDIAPIQLSPNSYRLAIALYIMYVSEGFPPPSMNELSHFVSLRKVVREAGYFYFAVCKSYNIKGFNQGRISHVKNWKGSYFYVFSTDRARTQFNNAPSKARHHLVSFSFFSSPFYLSAYFRHSYSSRQTANTTTRSISRKGAYSL